MKKTISWLAFLLIAYGVHAQQTGSIKLENIRFDHRGDNVYIEIDMPLRDYYVHDGSFLLLIPSIKSGTKEVSLPKIILGEANGAKETMTDVYAIQTDNNRSNLHYNVNVPYETWMDKAELILKKELGGSGYVQTETLNKILDKGKSDKQEKPAFAHLLTDSSSPSASSPSSLPSSDKSSGHLYTKSIDLHYTGMRSSNVLHVSANTSRIEEICNAINEIVNGNEYSLVGVYIRGYTSIHGIYYDNEQIAKKRAQSFQSYLQNRCGYPASYFNTSWIGEDWQGLVDLINKDENVPAKDRILGIIDNVGIFKGREKQLMMLQRGDPYRYMKQHFFNELQRVECEIIYKAK
ncbi:hypothetical protein GGR21_002289 [Dysgonomonas hofstadii]|uniref:DUF3868 domain-containing protein n=1 Tax=Dysgonomonas hofstadii TaxID=637886 RepID=A0A840CJZ9_9BACT|nr:OmpA family protein [Dysgonomonas hofstadii]MBB4036387.1 hypothetical protein [Dysgonomonas hofstadii]